MLLDVSAYLQALFQALQRRFGGRLLYMGLQGSYARGEAREDSDVDVLVVLDALHPRDMEQYRAALQELPYAQPSCGFLCGREDLLAWSPLEIPQLLGETRDLYGRLADFVPSWGREDLLRAIQLDIGNLYHALCHRRVHGSLERSGLKQESKQIVYCLQKLLLYRTGRFPADRAQLRAQLSGADLEVFLLAEALRRDEAPCLQTSFDRLFLWCQQALRALRAEQRKEA